MARVFCVELFLELGEDFHPKLDWIDRALRQPAVKALTVAGQVPRQRPGSPHARLRVRGIDPQHWPSLTLFDVPLGDEFVDANAEDRLVLFGCNEHSDNVERKLRKLLPELRKELRDERDVPEAVRCAAPVELVTIHREGEGVDGPRFRIGGHDIHVRPKEADALRRARVRAARRVAQHHVAPPLVELNVLHHHRTALGGVRREALCHPARDATLLWDQPRRRVVLQVLRLPNQLPKQCDVGHAVEAKVLKDFSHFTVTNILSPFSRGSELEPARTGKSHKSNSPAYGVEDEETYSGTCTTV